MSKRLPYAVCPAELGDGERWFITPLWPEPGVSTISELLADYARENPDDTPPVTIGFAWLTKEEVDRLEEY